MGQGHKIPNDSTHCQSECQTVNDPNAQGKRACSWPIADESRLTIEIGSSRHVSYLVRSHAQKRVTASPIPRILRFIKRRRCASRSSAGPVWCRAAKLPVDGVIVGGSGSINETPITGESVRKDKATGAKVFGRAWPARCLARIHVGDDQSLNSVRRLGGLKPISSITATCLVAAAAPAP